MEEGKNTAFIPSSLMDSLSVSDSPKSLQTHLELRSSFTSSYKTGRLHLRSIKHVLKALLAFFLPKMFFFSLVCEFWWDIIPISVCIAQHHIKSFLTMNVIASITLTDLSYCVSIQREISQERKFSKTNVTVKDRKR